MKNPSLTCKIMNCIICKLSTSGVEPVLKSKSASSPELCFFNNLYIIYNHSGALILLRLTEHSKEGKVV